MLIQIDDNTFATNERVAVIAPAVGNSRVVIKDSMRVGETADIPISVGILRARFEDNLEIHRLLLVVALLEADEAPKSSMQKGFTAFVEELRAAIVERLFQLNNAEGEDLQAIIDAIKKRVEGRVKSVIEDSLSGWQKAKVFAGTLDMDDTVASDFVQFGKPVLEPNSFTLTFESITKSFGIVSTRKYEIDAQLELRRVTVDRCQSQVDAVNAALGVMHDIEAQIQGLQAELQGASPAEKPFILSEIKRLREEEFPAAQEAVDAARRALAICRSRLPPHRVVLNELVQVEDE
ncbi:MAG: hypothetical protein ABI024_16525 [Vicinamibacterales bacterium]